MARRSLAVTLVCFVAHASAAAVKKPTTWQSEMTFNDRLISGAAARGTAQTVLHPIDVLRTRLQAKGVAVKWTPDTFLKGVGPQFFLAFPAGALQFAAYEWSKATMAAAKITGAGAEVLSGAVGALGASVIRVPQEVLKQRVQADIYPNAVVGFQKLMASEGPKGLYKGYTATISRDVPWNALSFMFFAQAKAIFKQVTGNSPNTEQNLFLGALSGMTAAVIMTRTRAAHAHTCAHTHTCACVRAMPRASMCRLTRVRLSPASQRSMLSRHAS